MTLSKTNIVTALVLSAALSACSFDTPSKITSNKLQLVQTVEQDVFATQNLTHDVLDSLAKAYMANDGGEMAVTVTYDPKSLVNTKVKAEREAKRIEDSLMNGGINSVSSSVLPVGSPPDYSVTTIRYVQYSAEGPKDCATMPGYENRADVGVVDIHQEYDYGCTIESLFAKQIANPSDLMGQDGFETLGSGRRAENAISGSGVYAPGPSPALSGERSSNN